MDKNKENEDVKSSVSLTAVIIFLVVIFLIFAAFLIYLRYSIYSPLTDFYHKNKNLTVENIASSIVSGVKNVDSGQTFEMKITADQIASSVNTRNKDFPLKDPKIEVAHQMIRVIGKTKTIVFPLDVEVDVVPKVASGTLQFEIKDILVSGVKAPAKIANTLSPQFTGLFGSIVPNLKNIEITDTRCMVGFVLVEGKKK